MQYTKRFFLSIFFLLGVGVFSLMSWHSLFVMMMSPGISDIWQPMPWLSLLVVMYFLGTAIWTRMSWYMVGAFLMFVPGLLFVRELEYGIALVVAFVLVWMGTVRIASEFQERVRFHFFKSMRAGTFVLFVALALAVSSEYYVFIKYASWEELVPRFRVGEEMTNMIFKIAGVINPSFAKLATDDATVDEFLLNLEASQQTQFSLPQTETDPKYQTLSLPPDVARYANVDLQSIHSPSELFLQSGREQIAQLVGRPVQGNEKISTVLSLALQNKMVMLLSGDRAMTHIPSQAIPFFLALLLFFTLLPFFSILGIVWIVVAHGIFVILLRCGWLRLEEHTVQQQRLAE